MTGFPNNRNLARLIVIAAISLAALACDTEQVQYYLTPTQVSPGHGMQAPGPTIVPATSLPEPSATAESTPGVSSEFEPTITPTSTAVDPTRSTPTTTPQSSEAQPTATSTRVPTATPTPQPDTALIASPTPFATPVPPEHHYLSNEEALAAAAELGCTGTTTKTIDGVFYTRPCASEDDFQVYALGARKNLSGQLCDLPGDENTRFTHAPTDLSQIASIVPSGSPSGGVIKPHSYLHNKDNPDFSNVRVPVYAVADAVVTSVAYYNTSVNSAEYLIFFDASCEISFKYDHLSELAPKLAAVAPDTPANDSRTTHTPPIELEAGELVGYSNGAGGKGAWDFGAHDLTHTNQFANQERYIAGHMGQSIHAVCPYDYFVEPLKSQMYALFGTHDQRLIPDIACTTPQRDVLGSAAGAWFATPELTFGGSSVSIAMLPGEIVAITGRGSDLRIEKDQPTWLDPERLTTDHCYAGDGRWFYIEIIGDGMQMSLAEGSGGCPASSPDNAITYYR
jgi:hypothetical protein